MLFNLAESLPAICPPKDILPTGILKESYDDISYSSVVTYCKHSDWGPKAHILFGPYFPYVMRYSDELFEALQLALPYHLT